MTRARGRMTTRPCADKVVLLPGQTASLANYTSYWLGINGIMIDLAGLHGDISLDDFSFKMGEQQRSRLVDHAPLPTQITVRAGAGTSGSDRIELIWGNGVQNQWLQVTLAANADTCLNEPDVFYFGNAAGESGNSATNCAGQYFRSTRPCATMPRPTRRSVTASTTTATARSTDGPTARPQQPHRPRQLAEV